MLTELMQHLQDAYSHHPGDDLPVIVALPTTPNTLERFEVGEVHHDGPSVILQCRPLQDEPASAPDEEAKPQNEEPRPPASRIRTCVHNDYEDLL
jgi:hypothetical protein